jgi:predicted ester cyclase
MNATELGQHDRRYIDCLNQREVDQLDQFVHQTIRYNGAPMSRDDWKAGPILATVEAMPDFRMSEIWSLFDEAGMKAQLMA